MKYILGIVASVTLGATASGDILFFDIGAEGWNPFLDAVAGYGYAEESRTAWQGLADWGLTGFDGPVDVNTENGTIHPGDIPYNLAFDSNLNPWGIPGPAGRGVGGNGLVGVGPSGGFGNPSNALLANYFVDSFDIFVTEGACKAMAFNALSLLGTNAVDITVFGPGEAVLGSTGGPAPAGGHWYGVLMTPDQTTIQRVNIYDVGGGAEGVMEVVKYVPAPGVLALFGLTGLVGVRRRRT
jgi:hypothetical protein